MKKEALRFLQNLPKQKTIQFNEGLLLLRRSAGVNERIIKQLNAEGYSPARLETLLYELKKVHEITEKELAKPIMTVNAESIEVIDELLVDRLKFLTPKSDDNLTPDAVTITTKEEVFIKAPDEVKNEVKLRDEFPFLNSLDCPDEFKIITADKLNHYHAYVAAHKALLVTVPEGKEGEDAKEPVELTNDEIFELAKAAVENFIINQDIYAELECYKNTGEILGKHPVMAALKRKEKIEKESPLQLANRKSNLINYVNRTTAELKETVDPERRKLLQLKIDGWEFEKELVENKLKADAK